MSEGKVLTPEQLANIRAYASDESNFGVELMRKLLAHIDRVSAERDALRTCYDGLLETGNKILAERDQLAAEAERLRAENADNFNQEFFALRDALRDWPKLPPAHVLKWLHFRFPEDWERGVSMQRELGMSVIPPKTECEGGAGMWDRITQGAWRSALSNQRGEKA